MKLPNWMKGAAPMPSSMCSIRLLDDDSGKGGSPTGGTGEGEGEGSKELVLGEDAKKYIGSAINAALTSRLKRGVIKDELGGMVTEAVTNAVTAALAANTGAGEGEGGKGDKGGGQGGDIHQHPDFQAMQARQKELESKLADQERARQDEITQRHRSEERSALEGSLRTAGVTAELVPAATALLFESRGVLGRNDQGTIVYKAQRDGYVDELKIEDGVREFLETAEGKSFMPAAGAGGSGARPGAGAGGGPPRTKDGDAMDVKEAESVLASALLGGV